MSGHIATAATISPEEACVQMIPQPIVNLNRWTLAVGLLLGFVLQQPIITTALL